MDQIDLVERLERIEAALAVLIEQRTIKDWYTTEEAAKMLGKAEFTVRNYCRLGRIRAHQGREKNQRPGEIPVMGNFPWRASARPERGHPAPSRLILGGLWLLRGECTSNRVLNHARVQMTIPFPLLFRLVPDRFINDPLIDASRRETGNIAVPEPMKASQHVPRRIRYCPLEMVMHLVTRN